jgi:hypothetical protein
LLFFVLAFNTCSFLLCETSMAFVSISRKEWVVGHDFCYRFQFQNFVVFGACGLMFFLE